MMINSVATGAVIALRSNFSKRALRY
jgi:hypothetical protein